MKEQNSLIESAVAHAQTYYRKTIERNQGKPLTEEQAFSINFITYGAIFAVRDQIRSSNMLSASKMANCIINNIPESMQNLIK